MTILLWYIAFHLLVGCCLCVFLRVTGKPPGHWLRYVELILAWPIIVYLAGIGRL